NGPALRGLEIQRQCFVLVPPRNLSLGQRSGMSLETLFSVLRRYVGRGPQSRDRGLNLNLAISVLPVPSGWIFHSAYLPSLVVLNRIHRPSGEYDRLLT